MGKHDKSTDNEFYEARIKRLEAEKAELARTVRALERDLARADRAYDRNTEEVDDIIAEKDAEIAMLNLKILKLVREHV